MNSLIEKQKGQISDQTQCIAGLNQEKQSRVAQIKQIEKVLVMMMDSALAPAKESVSAKIKEKLQSYLKDLDQLQQENYKLKLEISSEKKRYLDLMEAFLEVRN